MNSSTTKCNILKELLTYLIEHVAHWEQSAANFDVSPPTFGKALLFGWDWIATAGGTKELASEGFGRDVYGKTKDIDPTCLNSAQVEVLLF